MSHPQQALRSERLSWRWERCLEEECDLLLRWEEVDGDLRLDLDFEEEEVRCGLARSSGSGLEGLNKKHLGRKLSIHMKM